MKIRVIGCSGAEFPGHNTPAFLLDDEILFDAGSLTNILDEKAQLKISNIFITHAHLDHIRSIPFLADNIIVGNMGHKVTIFSIASVIKTIKTHLFNSAMWPDFTVIPHPDNAILSLVTLKYGSSIRLNSYTITPLQVNHPVPAVGYLVVNKEDRSFFYTGDSGPNSLTWKKIGDRQLNCLIIDVSFPDSMRALALKAGHLTPALLKDEIKKINRLPERIYITHPKPQHLKTIKKELKGLRMKNLTILREGDVIVV